MLKATGPVDLLNDYKKYENHICGLVRHFLHYDTESINHTEGIAESPISHD